MGKYEAAFAKIAASSGASQVDDATDVDWPSIETILSEYAQSQGSDMETVFADALDQYVTDADQSRDADGFRLTFNFHVLTGQPGTFGVTWN